ncbi:uncharacterized mitochondrial protein AtMg00860-like [Impatiens glandulifera]|uniref:uncharacterized mitochondrial protein AtMg00860-like n=1 Tax=Impatiens glandulifera TaxID=253017 RepID=UPI001FB0D866|nr:uncharacterized mitochondrial protein AtMg00860-like [Impatiens glandulifera]
MGHIINKQGVVADLDKLKAMETWPIPQSIKQLRGFLGLTGYYRRFIKRYGIVDKLLINILKKVLALPDFNIPFVVESDASGQGIGATIWEHNINIKKLISELRADPKAHPDFTFINGVLRKGGKWWWVWTLH